MSELTQSQLDESRQKREEIRIKVMQNNAMVDIKEGIRLLKENGLFHSLWLLETYGPEYCGKEDGFFA